jgi:hypothetical protein
MMAVKPYRIRLTTLAWILCQLSRFMGDLFG